MALTLLSAGSATVVRAVGPNPGPPTGPVQMVAFNGTTVWAMDAQVRDISGTYWLAQNLKAQHFGDELPLVSGPARVNVAMRYSTLRNVVQSATFTLWAYHGYCVVVLSDKAPKMTVKDVGILRTGDNVTDRCKLLLGIR
jgi:hypothetical protein